MTKNRYSSSMFKLAFLSISLLLTSTASISITIPKMQETFVNQSATAVEALVTASNITVMIFVLLSPFIVKVFGTRKTVLIGLLLAGVSGVVPMFSDNYGLVYISRLILGAGLGMFNSLAVSLINDFWSGDTRNKMLGFQSAVQSIGQTVTTFIAGILVNYNWHTSYSIYFLALASFILFLIYVPNTTSDTDKNDSVSTEQLNKPKQSINSYVILSSFGLLISFALLMALFLKSAGFVVEEKFENASFIGTALSIYTLVGFLGSLLYGYIVKVTKQYTFALSYAIIGASFLIIALAPNMTVITFGMAFGGIGGSVFLPIAFGTILEKAPSQSGNLAISIAMVGTNLGTYLSPYLLAALGNLFGNNSSKFSILISGVLMLALAVFYFLIRNIFKQTSEVKIEV
ncbi:MULTISPECIES: MFS transporter [Leuconostoc]|uniref:Bacillibactin exporter n=1 Tax=Leuconostoc suionicum TaxID=1511761 RepID=A0A2N9K9H7_9LACO|nr:MULTISPECIES: MFS transporter [Leuconostoc]API71925.1 MFS transporter permease [Leuconostoc suionicum]MBE4728269.1 MFS transporter [Leuconostoc suionicum]MCT4402154.1 MFS transporter [Leuconostoc suionicum]MDI6523114.1 MFS transporter [Leuconostoc suionicum]MDI6544285.1 MFS transporter [Leuconostoc suionicum]